MFSGSFPCERSRLIIVVSYAGPLLRTIRGRWHIWYTIVIHHAAAVGEEFIFTDDNARTHRGHLVNNFVFAEEILWINWPTCSLNINHIENVWDMLRTRGRRSLSPEIIQKLLSPFLQEWERITQSLIDTLIHSMTYRCAISVSVRGNHTLHWNSFPFEKSYFLFYIIRKKELCFIFLLANIAKKI